MNRLKYLMVLTYSLFTLHSSAQVWGLDSVHFGVKPVMEIDLVGNLHIVHVDESLSGFVVHVEITSDSILVDTITTGYFYGPADIAINNLGEPAIAVHNHHPGNLEYCIKKLDSVQWDCGQILDTGHDGWDLRLTFDADNHAHVLGIDPANDGFVNGIEYYEQLNDTTWVIDSVGLPVLGYGNGLSITLEQLGHAHTSVFHDSDSSLYYSTNLSGQWVNEHIDSNATGLFSSITLDNEGEPRIWSFQKLNDTMGLIVHHYKEVGLWEREIWDTLYDVEIGFNKAVNMIDVDGYNNVNYVSYADRRGVWMAWKEGEVLYREPVALYDLSTTLGQQTSIAINETGDAFICYSKIMDDNSQRRGETTVANRQFILSLESIEKNTESRSHINAYRIASGEDLVLPFSMDEIRIIDLSGKRVKVINNTNHISTTGLKGPFILELEDEFRLDRARLIVY